MPIRLLTMSIHLLIVTTHLLFILIFLLNVPTNLMIVWKPHMIKQILLLIQSILLIDHLQISRFLIPHFCNNYSWVCYSFVDQKSIFCSLKDLPSIVHHLYSAYVVSVFHNVHLPLSYQNSPPELQLHSTPNKLASIILVFELQIPCTCKVWTCSH